MKKQILATAIAISLLSTTSGWVVSHDKSEKQAEIIVEKNSKIDEQSTEIAKLDDAVADKDKKLDADKQVIEKQEDQLHKKDEELEKLKKELKKEQKKKPKVVEKVVYKEKQVNFKAETEGSDVGTKKQSAGNSIGTFEMTSYVAMCKEGCTGITRTGIDITGTTTYQGHRIIATDPSIIPLWSIVEITTDSGSFTAISLDTGGAINGNIIDYLVASEGEALNNGRQSVSVKMIRKGK